MEFENRYIDELIEAREIARKNKDWKLSDELRNYLDSKLVFIFDTKEGQEIYYLPEIYFNNKPDSMNNRQYVEYRIQERIRLEKSFDSWLYSIKSKL